MKNLSLWMRRNIINYRDEPMTEYNSGDRIRARIYFEDRLHQKSRRLIHLIFGRIENYRDL